MKRVVSLVAALALAVGAFAPAAFASDAGYGQTDLIPLEDLDQETFDTYLSKFYSQDYPTYGVLDLLRDTFQGGLSNASGVNDSVWSWALNLVDNANDIGTEIGLWLQGVEIDPNTGKVIYPDDYLTDYAKQLLDTQIMTTSPSNEITINGHVWVKFPITANNGQGYVACDTSWPSSASDNIYEVWITRTGSSGNVATAATWIYSGNQPKLRCYTNVNLGGFTLGNRYYYNGVNYYTNDGSITIYPSGMSQQYSSSSQALADFYSNFDSASSGGDSYFNGSGYYSDHQTGFSINLPSLPSTNWGNLSKYYYTTYGDEIIEGDVDRYYYNLANNYVPYEISYELPYWLINGSTNILDFDYSLELPTAELSTLPSDFEGGSNFWDNSFSMLAGFGSFIALGLSFALVGLFFKD